jgi:phage/plasmid-like protein (TIGR03299 family)
MPAEFVRGFFVREPAWHGLGIVLADYPGRDEAMRIAGHDFTIDENNIQSVRTGGLIETHKELYRVDSGERLSVVSKSYAIVQNSTAWDVVDAIVQQENVKYDTAGILRGGAGLWVMALLDEPVTIKGDDSLTFPYVSCGWSHDGSSALTVKRHAVRIVCANTSAAAVSEAKNSGRIFSFKHTVNVMSRIEAARQVLAGVRSGFADFVKLSNELAGLTVSDQGITSFIERLRPASTSVITERVQDNEAKDKRLILSYLNGPTIAPAIRNTAYGLVQAGVEFLDHGRRYQSSSTLLNRTILKGEPLKDLLVQYARDASREFPLVAVA